MTDVVILDQLRLAFLVAIMIGASYLDLRTREISDKIWYIALGGGALLNLVQLTLDFSSRFLLLLLSSLLIAGIIGFGIYYLGLFGGADAKAMLSIGMILPLYQPMVGIHPFAPVMVFSNGIILSLLPIIFLLFYNLSRIVRGHAIFSGFESEKSWRKALALIVGYRTRSSGGKFLLSIESVVDSKKSFDFSPAKAGDDFVETSETWVTPGIPLLVFITAGLLLMLAYGDLTSLLFLNFI